MSIGHYLFLCLIGVCDMAFEKELKLVMTIDGKNVKYQLSEIGTEVDKVGSKAQNVNVEGWQVWAVSLNQGVELLQRFSEIISQPIQQAGQFEQFRTTLRVMLGDIEVADERFREMVQFAAVTPFNVSGVISAGNQLQALGKYSLETMAMLGDLASAAGRPMEQAMRAYAKLASGQKGIAIDMFRDLLIATNDWGDATGKAFAKSGELMATPLEMLNSLEKIVRKKGFSGLMEQQSKTFVGRVSNMEDAVEQFQAKIGDIFLDDAKQKIENFTGLITFLSDNLKTIKVVVENLTIATVSYFAVLKGGAVVTYVITAIKLAFEDTAGAVSLAKGKIVALFNVVAKHPFGALAVAIGAVIVGLRAYNQLTEKTAEEKLEEARAHEDVIKQLHKEKKIQKELMEDKRDLLIEYDKLKKQVDETGETTKEYLQTLERVKNEYPDAVNTTDDLDRATFDLGQEMERTKQKAKEYSVELEELSKQLRKTETNTKQAVADMLEESMLDAFVEDKTFTVDKIYENTFGGVFQALGIFKSKIPTALVDFRGEMKEMMLPLTEARTYETAYDAWQETLNKLVSMRKRTLDDGTEVGTLSAEVVSQTIPKLKRLFAQQLTLIDDMNGDVESTVDKVQKMIETKRMAFGNDFEGYTKWLDTAMKELGNKKWDVSDVLGISIKKADVEDKLTYIKNLINAEVTRVKDVERTAKQETEMKKKKVADDRKDAIAQLKDKLNLNNTLLDLDVSYTEEYSKNLKKISDEYNKYVLKMKKSNTKLNESELKFGRELEEAQKETTKRTNKEYDKRLAKLALQERLDGKYKEAHIESFNLILDDYKKYIAEYGNGSDEEMAYLAKLVEKYEQLKGARKSASLFKLQSQVAEILVDVKIPDNWQDDLPKIDFSSLIENADSVGFYEQAYESALTLNEKMHSLRLDQISLIEDEATRMREKEKEQNRYLKDRLELVRIMQKELAKPVEGETDEKALQRKQMAGELLIEEKNLQQQLKEVEVNGKKEREESWKSEWQEKIDYLQDASDTMGRITDSLTQLFMANDIKRIDSQLNAQNKAIDAEERNALLFAKTEQQKAIVSQQAEDARIKAQEEADKKRHEIGKKQFAVQKAISTSEILINLATAISKIWSQSGLGAIVLQGLAIGALTAQLAVVASQEYPGFEKGGYTGDGDTKKKAGDVHKGEFVFDAKTTKKHRNLFEMIHKSEGGGVNTSTQFDDGGYVGYGSGGLSEYVPDDLEEGTMDSFVVNAFIQLYNLLDEKIESTNLLLKGISAIFEKAVENTINETTSNVSSTSINNVNPQTISQITRQVINPNTIIDSKGLQSEIDILPIVAELKLINKNLARYSERPNKVVFDKRTSSKVVSLGGAVTKKNRS